MTDPIAEAWAALNSAPLPTRLARSEPRGQPYGKQSWQHSRALVRPHVRPASPTVAPPRSAP